MSTTPVLMQGPLRPGPPRLWTKALLLSLLLLGVTLTLIDPAWAQTGGATGTATATQTRIVGVVTGWQLIIFAIGAFILSAAFMYVGYSMAFGGKKWTDVAMVAYGAMIAGMGPMLVAWFFSDQRAMNSTFLDPIYKGGTAPSTAFGVPLLVFILGAVLFGQTGLIVFLLGGLPATIAVAVLAASCYGWARRISKFDDQRLLQLVLRVRMRGPQHRARGAWGAVSFSPFAPGR